MTVIRSCLCTRVSSRLFCRLFQLQLIARVASVGCDILQNEKRQRNIPGRPTDKNPIFAVTKMPIIILANTGRFYSKQPNDTHEFSIQFNVYSRYLNFCLKLLFPFELHSVRLSTIFGMLRQIPLAFLDGRQLSTYLRYFYAL
jgi:hypothetical protein